MARGALLWLLGVTSVGRLQPIAANARNDCEEWRRRPRRPAPYLTNCTGVTSQSAGYIQSARVAVGSMRAKKLIPCQANTTNSERARQTMPKRYA